eukprot:5313228-Pyramimonas_sp.AAC.1
MRARAEGRAGFERWRSVALTPLMRGMLHACACRAGSVLQALYVDHPRGDMCSHLRHRRDAFVAKTCERRR